MKENASLPYIAKQKSLGEGINLQVQVSLSVSLPYEALIIFYSMEQLSRKNIDLP